MEPDGSIVVFGAGAVGGYLGAKLAAGNARDRVTLVGRPAVVEAMRARGLIVREFGAEIVTHPEAAVSSSGLRADLVLLAVRTFDVPAAIEELRPLIGPDTYLLAFQNGVGTEDDLARVFGADRVLAGTLTVSVGMEEPGVVTRYGGGGVALARMDGSALPAWVVTRFSETGLAVLVVDDYRALRWSKLLLNMLAAPTSAILDVGIEGIAGDRAVFRLEQRAFREAVAVMKALRLRALDLPGYRVRLAKLLMRLPRPLAQRLLAPRLIKARSGHSPGMRADIQRGRTEIEAFNGAVVRAGEEMGVPTPINAALARLTCDLSSHPERRDYFRARPDRLVAFVDNFAQAP